MRSEDAFVEYPVYFRGGENDLFGVFTRTTLSPNGVAVLLLTGGGWIPASNRNRLSVRLARAVSERGFHAMRFEYRGVGESTGSLRSYSLRKPFVDDVLGAVRWLQGQGIHEFVLVGSCFGSRTLLAAVEHVQGLRGVVLLAPPVSDLEEGMKHADKITVRDYARRLMTARAVRNARDRRRRAIFIRIVRVKLRSLRRALRKKVRPRSALSVDVSDRFVSYVDHLARGKVPTLFMYGEADEFFSDLREALRGRLGRIVRRAGSTFQLRRVDGVVHGFTRLTIQDHVTNVIDEWLSSEVVATSHDDDLRSPTNALSSLLEGDQTSSVSDRVAVSAATISGGRSE